MPHETLLGLTEVWHTRPSKSGPDCRISTLLAPLAQVWHPMTLVFALVQMGYIPPQKQLGFESRI
jgi:hypothetical protein